jgi:outer membrane protein assembly factor BamB
MTHAATAAAAQRAAMNALAAAASVVPDAGGALDFLYISISQHVVALDPTTGKELWRTKLPNASSIVTLLVRGPYVFAGLSGYIHALDRYSGAMLWSNELKGLGYGQVVMAMPGGSDAGAEAASNVAQSGSDASATM